MSQAIVTKMSIECPHCKNTIGLNVHRAEEIAVLLSFGIAIALAGFGYWLQSRGFAAAALFAALAGSGSVPLLERTYLRAWPRYKRDVHNPDR